MREILGTKKECTYREGSYFVIKGTVTIRKIGSTFEELQTYFVEKWYPHTKYLLMFQWKLKRLFKNVWFIFCEFLLWDTLGAIIRTSKKKNRVFMNEKQTLRFRIEDFLKSLEYTYLHL